MITSRNGAQMTVKTATGDFVITLTDATEVIEKEGRLGLRQKQADVIGLIPGLKVDVHWMAAPKGGLTATSVTFSAKDQSRASQVNRAGAPSRKSNRGALLGPCPAISQRKK